MESWCRGREGGGGEGQETKRIAGLKERKGKEGKAVEEEVEGRVRL